MPQVNWVTLTDVNSKTPILLNMYAAYRIEPTTTNGTIIWFPGGGAVGVVESMDVVEGMMVSGPVNWMKYTKEDGKTPILLETFKVYRVEQGTAAMAGKTILFFSDGPVAVIQVPSIVEADVKAHVASTSSSFA